MKQKNASKLQLNLKPDFVEAHYNLGNAQKKLGKHSVAASS